MDDDQIYADIHEAFLFAYSLVASELGLLSWSNHATADYDGAPINQIKLAKSVKDDGRSNGPNMETAYASAVLDLTAEPIIVSKPAVEPDRYFGMLVTTARGAVMEPLGTAGLGGQEVTTYAFVGPAYKGKLPKGVRQVKCTGNLAILAIRIREFPGVANDYATVDALQKKLDIRPLSAYRDANYVPPAGTVDPDLSYDPLEKKANISIVDFFNRYNRLTSSNPAEGEYTKLEARFRKYNIGAGKTFTLDGYGPELTARLNGIPQDFEEHFPEYAATYRLPAKDGWSVINGDALEIGGDYNYRNAYYYYQPPSVNPPRICEYYSTKVDSDGNSLNGANRYRMHFEEGTLPGFKQGGFWSMVRYVGPLVTVPVNSTGRDTLNDSSPLAVGKDGSTDIYLQPEAPTDAPESNWLPTSASDGDFTFTMRVYCPQDSVVESGWVPPRLERIE
ncbi:DUF1214 domain-containing protein [Streptomyces scopuliridis]|uniref:DUF1214 domain-containing protein n=1 Tax=Streptomyces scopuliridis TaxID=452529 RepID=UPI0035D8A57C